MQKNLCSLNETLLFAIDEFARFMGVSKVIGTCTSYVNYMIMTV